MGSLARSDVKVTNFVIGNYFGIHHTVARQHIIARGNRLDLVYVVLNRRDLTDKQKRAYIMGTSLTELMKQKVWTRFLELKES